MSSSQKRREGGWRGGNVDSARRTEILTAATQRFGRDGYENTKWADIAADVGLGPTALYHYFESKQHCLFVILDDAIQEALDRFERIAAAERDHGRALKQVVADAFELTPLDVQRLRVLVAEHGLLVRSYHASDGERAAGDAARARTRDLELAWATLLARAMEQGAVPESDPRLLARSVLGLYNSIWHWYRPQGIVPLEVVAGFYAEKMLDVIGVTAEPEQGRRAA